MNISRLAKAIFAHEARPPEITLSGLLRIVSDVYEVPVVPPYDPRPTMNCRKTSVNQEMFPAGYPSNREVVELYLGPTISVVYVPVYKTSQGYDTSAQLVELWVVSATSNALSAYEAILLFQDLDETFHKLLDDPNGLEISVVHEAIRQDSHRQYGRCFCIEMEKVTV